MTEHELQEAARLASAWDDYDRRESLPLARRREVTETVLRHCERDANGRLKLTSYSTQLLLAWWDVVDLRASRSTSRVLPI